MKKTIHPKSIYVIHNTEIDRVKVGVSENVPNRLRQLELSGGCKMELSYCSEACYNSEFLEKKIHGILREHKYIGEWFSVDPQHAIDVVKVCTEGSLVKESNNNNPVNLIGFKRLKRGIYLKDDKLFSVSYVDGNWDIKLIE
jgi:hypothetical protein